MTANSEKRTYTTPQLMRVELDNEISLILVSGNGGDDPNNPNAYAPTHFNNDPYKVS